MTRVKICGLTRGADRDAAVSAGADALGFISGVPVETPRELGAREAAGLVAEVEPFVTSVLVTGPDSVQEAVVRQEQVDADVVQVHGDLPPASIGGLGERVDASVIVAVDVGSERVGAYAAAADALLLDSTTETGMGGTGETHDWERSREVVESVDSPVVLAGGLTPANVGAAVETVAPFAVDVSSGVETTPGQKDHDAVRAFVARAAGAGA
ncbi:MAG: phosphoribosylanthranilate isomerase [halophilic archaeon J07HX64]|jgi:phosphoribosylanthranilate isomerase (EC 5.3.1.24)|nr:MAG: phosphoribosylanthranilate isomerase [halophilic archaeon J07HX64]